MQLLNRSNSTNMRRAVAARLTPLIGVSVVLGTACYHPAMVAGVVAPTRQEIDSVTKVAMQRQPRCNGYYLLVENALPRAVEIYEVGHMTDRLVAYAQIGYTEVPMTEGSQQFIAMSRGEVMAVATNSDQRAGDRVALSRSCRPF